MECTVSRILITGYIDNELSDDEMRQLKSHLQACEGCVAHLHKMERMQTVLRRYQLVQDIPEAPSNFARNVSRILQETVPAESQPSVFRRAAFRYRAFVMRLAERWVCSLRARPVTWVTSVSCVFALLAGVAFFDMAQVIQAPLRYTLNHPKQNVLVDNRSSRLETGQPGQSPKRLGASPIFEIALHEESIESDSAALPDFIRFSDEAVVQIAKTTTEPVDSYVYSHIVEASQEQFLDNPLFASYVQDALFQ
jgi:hypothetical protein